MFLAIDICLLDMESKKVFLIEVAQQIQEREVRVIPNVLGATDEIAKQFITNMQNLELTKNVLECRIRPYLAPATY